MHAIPADANRKTRFLEFWGHGLAACVGFGLSLVYCIVRVTLRVRVASTAHDSARVMHRLVCRALRLRVHIENESGLQVGTPCVYVANHQSYLDYPVLGRVLPLRTIIVGKSEMQRIPIVGWLFKATGNAFIPRSDATAAHEVLEQLACAICDGSSVWMFPEGTRRSTPEPLLRFRSGAFRLAAMADVPVVPVVLSSLKPATDIRARRLEPNVLTISVLEPVRVASVERGDVVDAMTIVRERMLDTMIRVDPQAG